MTTREDVIRMAREAGIDDWWDSGNETREVLQRHIERFAALVAAAERERCAKVCDEMAELVDAENTPRASDASRLIDDCAAAIRALP